MNKYNKDHIITYKGHTFSPLNAITDDIDIRDIAHSLSLMTRANGHFSSFYSVAGHSILCAREASCRNYSSKVALFCLLHDGSEAYISDITRPVKIKLPEYKNIELKLQNTIYKKFVGTLPNEEEKRLISSVDDAALYDEFMYFMKKEVIKTEKLLVEPDYSFTSFEKTENDFLDLFNRLTDELNNK